MDEIKVGYQASLLVPFSHEAMLHSLLLIREEVSRRVDDWVDHVSVLLLYEGFFAIVRAGCLLSEEPIFASSTFIHHEPVDVLEGAPQKHGLPQPL